MELFNNIEIALTISTVVLFCILVFFIWLLEVSKEANIELIQEINALHVTIKQSDATYHKFRCDYTELNKELIKKLTAVNLELNLLKGKHKQLKPFQHQFR